MARAFYDDPFLRYVLPIDADRQRLLPSFFLPLMRAGRMFGETYSIETAAGAAYWSRPGQHLTDEQESEAGMTEVATILGEDAFKRFTAVVELCRSLHTRDARAEHWHLELLGVDTPLQGQGIGSALLQPVLQQADEQGTPCYLETLQPRNVPFYQGHGFEVVVEMVEPKSNLGLWTFWREPRR
jgi:GNAT superfamily N-acetyltransferase